MLRNAIMTDMLTNIRASLHSQFRRLRQQVFGQTSSDDEENDANTSNGIFYPAYLYIQRFTGARNVKYALFVMLLLGLFSYTLMFQSHETALYKHAVQQIRHQKQIKSQQLLHNTGSNKSSLSGNSTAYIYPINASKSGNIRGSNNSPVGSSSSTLRNSTAISVIGGSNNGTSSTGGHFADRTAQLNEIQTSFWISLFLSLATWVVIVQIIRYIQRVSRSRSVNTMDRTTQIQMISQLARYSRNPGIARRLQLALLNRDFTPEDYEVLQQLDDVRFGGTGSSGARRPATEASIQRLPVHIVTEEDLNHGELGNCNICLAPYEVGDEVRTIQCLHKFHSNCVDRWLRSNGVCPICKYQATDELTN